VRRLADRDVERREPRLLGREISEVDAEGDVIKRRSISRPTTRW
jgi:hypothetical protein